MISQIIAVFKETILPKLRITTDFPPRSLFSPDIWRSDGRCFHTYLPLFILLPVSGAICWLSLPADNTFPSHDIIGSLASTVIPLGPVGGSREIN